MTLKLTAVHIRVVDQADITAEDESQSQNLARIIIQEMQRIGKVQAALDNQPRFQEPLPSK